MDPHRYHPGTTVADIGAGEDIILFAGLGERVGKNGRVLAGYRFR